LTFEGLVTGVYGAGNMVENERGAKYAIKIKRQNRDYSKVQ
jgi:hypothetical protein